MIESVGKYYFYRHIRLDTNQVFYIGMGTKCKDNSYNATYARAYTKHERNPHWKNIFNKTEYRVEIVLESNSYEFIKEKEIEFIKLYGRKDLGFGVLVNMTDGGEGMLGCNFSEEHRKNLSKARMGIKLPLITTQKMSQSRIGIKFSKETLKKMSDVKKDKKQSKESIEKSAKNRQKSIVQYSLSGNFIKTWESIGEAAKTLCINRAYIGQVCKEKGDSAGGFIWKYLNN
tara:strand:+ start:39977 stop:40666 length:690 start_codon:yes stop_codon:yes gene_type:complete